jgi:hypothetical protein
VASDRCLGAITVCDVIVARFGTASEPVMRPVVREQDGKALNFRVIGQAEILSARPPHVASGLSSTDRRCGEHVCCTSDRRKMLNCDRRRSGPSAGSQIAKCLKGGCQMQLPSSPYSGCVIFCLLIRPHSEAIRPNKRAPDLEGLTKSTPQDLQPN